MPTPESHIKQACDNLKFLEKINSCHPCSWDWHVTVSFYVAVHIVNSHLAKFNLHYRSHADVTDSINPQNPLSVTQLPEDIYLAYKKLQGLSRRSRYLVHDSPENHSEDCHFTYDKHFVKAVKKLDTILDYFIARYQIIIPDITVKCPGLRLNDTKVIKIIL